MNNGISRPSHIEINLGALQDNISLVKSWIGQSSKFMAVVKANAYGHGLKEVALLLKDEPISFGEKIVGIGDVVLAAGTVIMMYQVSPPREALRRS